MQIPLIRPTMRRRYMHQVLTQLVEEEVGPGRTTRELVGGLSSYVGAAGGVALSSMYDAVSLAAEVVGLKPGDRVIVPGLAPAVYLDVLRHRGLSVLLADSDPATGCVATETLASLVHEGARALIAYHVQGIPMSFEVAVEAGIPVIEDVTHSLAPSPAAEDGLVTGSADLTLISLSSDGAITAGAGAALLARKRALVAGLKSAAGNMADHAQLPNMGAALALAQLADIDTDRVRRLEIAALYRSSLRRSRHGALASAPGTVESACAFAVRLRDGLAEVRQYARKHGIETRPAFEGSCVGTSEDLQASCPHARTLLLCCLLFPLYPMLGRRDIELVCKVLATLP
jgi:perosamine synthetase